jgi:hypothetical protein
MTPLSQVSSVPASDSGAVTTSAQLITSQPGRVRASLPDMT